jgi:hypothetical protein
MFLNVSSNSNGVFFFRTNCFSQIIEKIGSTTDYQGFLGWYRHFNKK